MMLAEGRGMLGVLPRSAFDFGVGKDDAALDDMVLKEREEIYNGNMTE